MNFYIDDAGDLSPEIPFIDLSCSICKMSIYLNDSIVSDGDGFAHSECSDILRNKDQTCGYCNKHFEDDNGVVVSIINHGLIKLHINCYKCVDCSSMNDLILHKVNDMKTGRQICVPLCGNCRKCYVCKSNEYNDGRYFSDGNYTRQHIVICNECLGTSQDEEVVF